ncbi:MAG: EAL domain-containing protein [Gammaproteobacteria bacterium]
MDSVGCKRRVVDKPLVAGLKVLYQFFIGCWLMSQIDSLFPYFQPIVGAASGRIIGYEALARRLDENRQPVSAGDLFSNPDIPYESMIEYDRNVRRKALERFVRVSGGGYLTLNISAAWLDHIENIKALPTLQMIDQLAIDRNRIIMEINEAKGDVKRLTEIVKIYRKHGLKVAIDDFGAGFSQLERIMAIRPDFIKLDMRLFKKASKKGGVASDIIQLLTRLGNLNGCRIVCEGVETDEEFFFGVRCGAHFMQGYLFSEAVADFVPNQNYNRHIDSLRKKFLQKTLDSETKRLDRARQAKILIDRLQQALQSDFNLNELSSWPFEKSGILRFYLCNNDGTQISSNFNFNQGKWFEDPRQIGFNWSWRPYFYQLLAHEQAGDGGRLIESSRYRDFNTDQLCRTLSLRLDEERILLIDVTTDAN